MRQFLIILGFITIISGCKNKIELTQQIKLRLKNEVSNMLIRDQKYRWQIMYGELNEVKLDSLKKLPDSIRFAIFGRINTKRYGLTKHQADSIWVLQSNIDSLNEIRLSQVIDSFGFPSKILIGTDEAEELPLHFSNGFKNKYYPVLVKQAKSKLISPDVVAQMYDRLMMETGKVQVYGSSDDFNSETGESLPPLIEDIQKTNKLRIEIGMDTLKSYRLTTKTK
jgi:hypothetical protein